MSCINIVRQFNLNSIWDFNSKNSEILKIWVRDLGTSESPEFWISGNPKVPIFGFLQKELTALLKQTRRSQIHLESTDQKGLMREDLLQKGMLQEAKNIVMYD